MSVSHTVAFAMFLIIFATPLYTLFTSSAEQVKTHLSLLRSIDGVRRRSYEEYSGYSLTVLGWSQFLTTDKDGLTYRYYYVSSFSAKFLNGGDVGVGAGDLELSDVYLAYSKNVGSDAEPSLERFATRIPYVAGCSDQSAPCWDVVNGSALVEPAQRETLELTNRLSRFGGELGGSWDSGELLEIVIHLPQSMRLTLAQIESQGNVVGGEGWIYVELCIPSGYCGKPASLLGIAWRLGEEVRVG